ncbi:hypothetical protein L9F63_018921, partial [Diploptera punctata]
HKYATIVEPLFSSNSKPGVLLILLKLWICYVVISIHAYICALGIVYYYEQSDFIYLSLTSPFTTPLQGFPFPDNGVTIHTN